MFRDRLSAPDFRTELINAACVGRMASVLALSRQAGLTEWPDDRLEMLAADVASVAEEFYASPCEVQAALEVHEPSLAIGAEEI